MAILQLTTTPINATTCQVNWSITGINVAACSWAAVSVLGANSLPVSGYADYIWDDGIISGSGANGSASGNFTIDQASYPTTFPCFGVARSISNDAWYSAGGYQSVATSYTSSPRPSFFDWTFTKTTGSTFNLTAKEWNDFLDNINLVRTFKGSGTIWYTTAVQYEPFISNMYDEAHSAVNQMRNFMSTQGRSNIDSILSWATGQIITANHLNYLQLALNTVI